jgi:hypothetical protein
MLMNFKCFFNSWQILLFNVIAPKEIAQNLGACLFRGIANISDKTGVKQKLGSSNSDF